MKKIIISILSIAVILPTVLFLFVKAQNNNSVNFAEVNTDYNITLSKNEKNPFITDKNYKAANSADNDVNINITKIQDNSVTANGYILLDNKKVEYIATGEMDEYNINGKAAQKAALFGMLLDGKGTDMTISFASINSENKIAGSVIINSVIGNGTDNSKSMAFGEEFEEIYQIIQKDLEDTQEEIPDYVSKGDETSHSDVAEIDMGESSGEGEYSMNTEKGMYVSQRSVSGYSWAFSDYYLYTGQDIPENRRNYIGVSIFYPKTVSSNLSYRAYMKLHCDDEVVKDYIKSKVNTGAYGFSFNDTICNLSFTVPNVNFGGYIIQAKDVMPESKSNGNFTLSIPYIYNSNIEIDPMGFFPVPISINNTAIISERVSNSLNNNGGYDGVKVTYKNNMGEFLYKPFTSPSIRHQGPGYTANCEFTVYYKNSSGYNIPYKAWGTVDVGYWSGIIHHSYTMASNTIQKNIFVSGSGTIK